MQSIKIVSLILVVTLLISVSIQEARAQEPLSTSSRKNSSVDTKQVASLTLLARVFRGRRPGFSLMPSSRNGNVSFVGAASADPAVHGSGTVGKISMWVDMRPNGDSILGDSIITQSNGNIGIGIATPMSKLSVQGMIETTLGGYKFPDGTVQTTAAVTGLLSVTHDLTLTGDGTSGSPLGVAVPLSLSHSSSDPVLSIHNSCCIGLGGEGVLTRGGDSLSGQGGNGIRALGGNSNNGLGGNGVSALGGNGKTLAGPGVRAIGGIGTGGGVGGDAEGAFGGNRQTAFRSGGIGGK